MYSIKPRIIGHRGACGYAPENTMASFRVAHEMGVKYVEFDVMLAKCGQAVIIHDITVNRTTHATGAIIDYSFEELQLLDAGKWFNPRFQGEKIPSFLQIMRFLQQNNMSAVIEIKPYPGYEAITAEVVLSQLNHLNQPFDQSKQIISSFSLKSLQRVRELAPHIHLGLGVDSWDLDWHSHWEKQAVQLQCQSIHINHKILTPEKVAMIQSNGFDIFAYTVNDYSRAEELFLWGIDAIFTDYPDKFRSFYVSFEV